MIVNSSPCVVGEVPAFQLGAGACIRFPEGSGILIFIMGPVYVLCFVSCVVSGGSPDNLLIKFFKEARLVHLSSKR